MWFQFCGCEIATDAEVSIVGKRKCERMGSNDGGQQVLRVAQCLPVRMLVLIARIGNGMWIS